ncbi:MAG: lysine--tRNA ligase, partial [Geminicoccaceae bacterium]|nr:lysine--tRNA ligase [Geminicoccaceae bacterium]
DYEMSGKDLIDSVKLGSQICRVMGGTPPLGFTYELFLDENGEKISKSRGNGITIDEWLRYATPESLMLFLYRDPKKAKKLYFDAIPRNVDDYESFVAAFEGQVDKEKLGNPVWHIHDGKPPEGAVPINYSMLLNLASVVNAEDPEVLWGFIRQYSPKLTPESEPRLARLVDHAIAYYQDRVRPEKRHREPDATERAAMLELEAALAGLAEGTPGEAIQNEVYEIGKRHGFESLRDWFKALYEVLLGQEQGPRFGSFVALYGVANTRRLIREALGLPAAAVPGE